MQYSKITRNKVLWLRVNEASPVEGCKRKTQHSEYYLHHLYMAKPTLTSMMQTKHNQLHKFSTLEEQFTIGKCEQFKRLSSFRYSRHFLKWIYKYSILKTNLSRKASNHITWVHMLQAQVVYIWHLCQVCLYATNTEWLNRFWNLLQEITAMMCQHTEILVKI